MTEECLCGCGCFDPPMPKDWMCSNCSEQKHLGNRDNEDD